MAVAEMPRLIHRKDNRRLWTADEFQRMAKLGLFDDERLELIQGEIYEKMPQDPPHATCITLIMMALSHILTIEAFVRDEKPANTGVLSLPEPDVAVLRGGVRDYTYRHPTAMDMLLVVEVSDTTPRKDRGVKKSDYALAGIPEYWIVNLKARKIEVFRDPQNGKWQTEFTKTQTDDISPLFAPTTAIPVKDLLP